MNETEVESGKYNLTTILDDGIEKRKDKYFIIDYHVKRNKRSFYHLLNLNLPLQKYNFRMKSFITTFARYKMAMKVY